MCSRPGRRFPLALTALAGIGGRGCVLGCLQYPGFRRLRNGFALARLGSSLGYLRSGPDGPDRLLTLSASLIEETYFPGGGNHEHQISNFNWTGGQDMMFGQSRYCSFGTIRESSLHGMVELGLEYCAPRPRRRFPLALKALAGIGGRGCVLGCLLYPGFRRLRDGFALARLGSSLGYLRSGPDGPDRLLTLSASLIEETYFPGGGNHKHQISNFNRTGGQDMMFGQSPLLLIRDNS